MYLIFIQARWKRMEEDVYVEEPSHKLYRNRKLLCKIFNRFANLRISLIFQNYLFEWAHMQFQSYYLLFQSGHLKKNYSTIHYLLTFKMCIFNDISCSILSGWVGDEDRPIDEEDYLLACENLQKVDIIVITEWLNNNDHLEMLDKIFAGSLL